METCSALLSSFARRPTHLGSVQRAPPPALVQRRDSFHKIFFCGFECYLIFTEIYSPIIWVANPLPRREKSGLAAGIT